MQPNRRARRQQALIAALLDLVDKGCDYCDVAVARGDWQAVVTTTGICVTAIEQAQAKLGHPVQLLALGQRLAHYRQRAADHFGGSSWP